MYYLGTALLTTSDRVYAGSSVESACGQGVVSSEGAAVSAMMFSAVREERFVAVLTLGRVGHSQTSAHPVSPTRDEGVLALLCEFAASNAVMFDRCGPSAVARLF